MIREAKEIIYENKSEICDILILSFLTLLILYTVDFQSTFINTVPEGGDYLFHFVKSSHMKTYASPFQLNSWMESTYLGVPLFSSYPPLFFIITQWVSFIIPLNIAFKILSLLGVILLPLILYISIKKIRPDDNSAILCAIFIIPIIFHIDHFAYGANIKSIIVGEFCYSLALLFFIPYVFLMYEGIKEKKYLILNIILLFLTCLMHPVPAVIGLFMPLFFLFSKNVKENAIYLVKFYIPTAFLWLVWFGPHIQKVYSILDKINFFDSQRGYKYGWPLDTLYSIFPKPLIPFILLFLAVILIFFFIYLFRKKKLESTENYLLFGLALSCLFFLFRPIGWAIRFLPLVYLFIILFLGFLIGRIIYNLNENKFKIIRYAGKLRYILIFVILALLIYMVFSYNLVQPMKNMANYQFKGQENVPGWKDQQKILDYIKTQPYDSRIASYSIKSEVVYIFDRRGTVGGMFIYSIVGEIMWNFKDSIETSMNNFSEEYLRKLDMLNVGYIITTKNINITNTRSVELILKSGQQQLLKIKTNSNSFVSKIPNKPYLVTDIAVWRNLTFNQWFYKEKASYPLIAYSKSIEDKEKERFIIYEGEYHQDNSTFYTSDCYVNSTLLSQKIEIDTNCIEQPLLVKISYFPNWKVKGADKIYLVTPGFMLIYPNQNHVVIYYGKNFVEVLSLIAFFIGVLLIILLSFKKISIKIDNFLDNLFDILSVDRIKEFILSYKRILMILYGLCIVLILILILSIGNIYYKFPHDITDSVNFNKAKMNYYSGNNAAALKGFEKIQSKKYVQERDYFISMIYFKQDNFEKAKDSLFSYISKAGNTEQAAELRYNYILAILKQNDTSLFLHEIHMINNSHKGSPWREKAMSVFDEWARTHDYDPAELK